MNYTLAGNYAYNHIANPLKASDNSISALFPNANEGDYILRWDVAAYDFAATIPTFSSGAWSDAFPLNPGEGVFYVNTSENPLTVTYVGEVIQGSFTNNLVGNYAYNSIGSSAPLGGSFVNAIAGLTPNEGDYILTWDIAAYDFGATIPTFSSGAWSDTQVTLKVGEGFMYVNTGENTIQWIRNFTVAP